MTELLEEFSFAQIENYPVTDVKTVSSIFDLSTISKNLMNKCEQKYPNCDHSYSFLFLRLRQKISLK